MRSHRKADSHPKKKHYISAGSTDIVFRTGGVICALTVVREKGRSMFTELTPQGKEVNVLVKVFR